MKSSSGRILTAAHLLLVWATMAAAVPALGFGLVIAAWGGGGAAAVLVLALGVAAAVGLLAVAHLPLRGTVPRYDTTTGILGRALPVFALGTFGVLTGVAACSSHVDLGSAGTRIALTGAPYAFAAAFFVPSRPVRLGAAAVLAAAVAYAGLVLSHVEQRRFEAEVARYRQHQELLYAGDAPPGMEVLRATAGNDFRIEYRPVGEYDLRRQVSLTVRHPPTLTLRCPPPRDGVTCAVEPNGDLRKVARDPSGSVQVTLTRRHRDVQVDVTTRTPDDEPWLRRLLDTLHPLSDGELKGLMRQEKIVHTL
ncbi:hypothetical protein ACGFX4_31810 [Kitasatospora sp. NPDC048365]|uniref:hypothetical protein n=1 Tax=Kitasatospora sp. NPDC048365 TaxID=3364050 RepID=UPI00371F8B80